jgi:hypothetical protein
VERQEKSASERYSGAQRRSAIRPLILIFSPGPGEESLVVVVIDCRFKLVLYEGKRNLASSMVTSLTLVSAQCESTVKSADYYRATFQF